MALSTLALGCPARGATVAIQAVSNGSESVFAPAAVTITQGDTVTWSTDGIDAHNVHFEEFSFVMPDSPSTSVGWPVSTSLTQPGTYHYYCDAHGGPGGVGMSGTIVVNAAPAGGGGGPGPPPPPADTAPVSTLIAPSKQRVDELYVRASMNEAGTLAAAGTVAAPGGAAKRYRLKRTTRSVSANQSVKLRLKLAARALRRVKRALRHGRRLRAKILVTARDATGHETVRRQTVRLKR